MKTGHNQNGTTSEPLGILLQATDLALRGQHLIADLRMPLSCRLIFSGRDT